MSWWWEDGGDEFKRWLESVFSTPSDDQQRIADFQEMAAGKKDPSVTLPGSTWDRRVQPALNDHEENNPLKGSTPAPTPSVSPTPVPSPSGQRNLGQQSAQEFLQGVVASAGPEWAATQRQTQGSINGVNPKAPVYDPRTKKTQVGKPSEFAPKITKMETRPLDDIIRDPFSWEDEKVRDIGTMMFHANLIGEGDILNRDKVGNAWAVLASTSARMFEMGKKVTPMDLLKRQSYGGIGGSLSKTTTSTSTNYSVTNATTAKQLAQAALSQRVGRKASDEEVEEFIKALRAEEKKNPTVQTSTTTTNAAGTSQTSTSTTKEGLNPNAFSDKYAMDYDTEEAKAYQAAGYYAPIFFEALKAPA